MDERKNEITVRKKRYSGNTTGDEGRERSYCKRERDAEGYMKRQLEAEGQTSVGERGGGGISNWVMSRVTPDIMRGIIFQHILHHSHPIVDLDTTS